MTENPVSPAIALHTRIEVAEGEVQSARGRVFAAEYAALQPPHKAVLRKVGEELDAIAKRLHEIGDEVLSDGGAAETGSHG